MASVLNVAKYFLVLAGSGEEDAGESMTHLKLQKLLYYVQGFHIALNNGAGLFADPLRAWKHGPVVTGVWDTYKVHGSAPIPIPDDFQSDSLTGQEKELLNDVWNTYGQFSAWKLRDMTHAEPPWNIAYRQGENTVITETSLNEYFVTQIE